VRERDFRVVSTSTVDLADTGLAVRAERPVLTGELVIVSMKVPFGVAWFDAEAIVTRVVHGRRRTDRGRSLGLAFTRVDGDAMDALRYGLSWLGERAPTPRFDRRVHQSIGR